MTIACSALAADLGEDMAGTAPAERGVLVFEQTSPWGRDALTESPCPPEVSHPLGELAKAAGLRVQVVRRTTRRYPMEIRHVWLACVTPGRRFLEALTVEDPRELLDLDLAAVAAGHPTGRGTLEPEPLFLACSHSTRDPCCARFGLPLVRELMKTAPRGRVWHTSHLGGHRFAATMAILPHGTWLGRVPIATAAGIVQAAQEERVLPELLRGRAGLPPAAQAAEIAVRRAEGIDALDGVAVHGIDGDIVHLTGAEGRAWDVEARHEPTGRVRPLSCGPGAKREDPGRWVTRVLAG